MQAVRQFLLSLILILVPFTAVALQRPPEPPPRAEGGHAVEGELGVKGHQGVEGYSPAQMEKLRADLAEIEKQPIDRSALHLPHARPDYIYELNHPPVTIKWRKVEGKPVPDAYRLGTRNPPSETWVDYQTLMKLQDSGQPVVHTGAVPTGKTWDAFTSTHSNVIVHVEGSRNADEASRTRASALGAKTLQPDTTRIFNALPQQSEVNASSGERERMGLGQTGDANKWKTVNEEIEKRTEKYPHKTVATRAALLKELHTGTANVVIVYAHFDGRSLHLPGNPGTAAENTISVSELAKMNRIDAPDRVILLVACSTARPVNGESLVQVLLKNGLARTVFATDQPYDAREIPALMSRLSSNPIREVSGWLHQYVELQLPPLFTRGDPSFNE